LSALNWYAEYIQNISKIYPECIQNVNLLGLALKADIRMDDKRKIQEGMISTTLLSISQAKE
jgi:hypothetical protein